MNTNAACISFGSYFFVWGMEWRLLEPTEKLARSNLTKLSREGMRWYASNGLQNFVGMCNHISDDRRHMHSAALHLASQWSNGNLELFVFGMPAQQVALVALNERRPLPGFDFIGSLTQAQALIDEFESIHQGVTIRRVGDLGLLVEEEPLSLSTVFDQPNSDSKLKKMLGFKTLLIFAVALLLGLGALSGAYYLQYRDRARLLTEAPEPQPPDPNLAYDQQVLQKVKALNAENQFLYSAWMSMAMQLPLTHQGWELTQIECKIKDCKATWRYQFGSAEDFYNHPLPNTHDREQLVIDKNVLTQQIQTTHIPPAYLDKPIYEKPSDLPRTKQGFRIVTSWLQDLSLIGAQNAMVEPAKVWSPTKAVASSLKNPIFKGNWSVDLPLSMASDLKVPTFASVTFMQTNLGSTYQLSGDFYVYADSP
jgi:hypothetical protein